jgi:hypothetical protein
VIRRLASGLAALVALLGWAVPVTAEVVPAKTAWLILPSETQSGEMTVTPGDVVLESRVVPISVSVLDDDLLAPDKADPLLRKGDQLFRLIVTGKQRIFCSAHPRKGQLVDVLLIRIPDTYVCLVDADADGTFDSFYQLRTKNSTALPVFVTAKLDGTPLTKPLAYHAIDPRTFNDEYLFRIIYNGKPWFGKKPAFGVTFGTRKAPEPLTARAAVDLSTDHHQVAMARSSFTLVSVESGTAHIRIDHGIPAQPFMLNIPPPRIIYY